LDTASTVIRPPTRSHGQDARATSRVLFSLPGLHRVNRGAEVVMEEVAARLAAEGRFDVTVFGGGPPRRAAPYRYRKLRGIPREWFEKFPNLPYVRDHYMWEELAYAPSLYSNFRPRDYDVTVTCGYPYSNMLLRRGRKGSRHPAHVFITQNGDWMVQARNAEYKHFGCDGLVCTNPAYYERHGGRYPCALIPNGVDTTRFHPVGRSACGARPEGHDPRASLGLPTDAPVILIVSALIPSKRVPDGIRAAANVPAAHLVVAGDGEQRGEVDALGHELMNGRFRRVTLSREQMPHLYRAADVLLHMSQDEPFGNIYIEALASGLPVVAHATAVTKWILGDHAELLDTGDLTAVTRALEASLTRRAPEQVDARRAAAETRFSWPAVAQQYGDFFERVFRQSCHPEGA
jgi:glycosyltransferase involved in cell wall biosynthesis